MFCTDTPRLELEDPCVIGGSAGLPGDRNLQEDGQEVIAEVDEFEKENADHVQSLNKGAQNGGKDKADEGGEEARQADKEEEDGADKEGKDVDEQWSSEDNTLEMSVDLGVDTEKKDQESATSPNSQVKFPTSAKSPTSLQHSYQDEAEPVEFIHQMWAPSTKSLEMSDTIGEGITVKKLKLQQSLRLLAGGSSDTNAMQKLLKESKVKLPRILGLDKFQDAFELRCNLSHAADCMDENEHLSHSLRNKVIAIRPKQAGERNLQAAFKEIQMTAFMEDLVRKRANNELLPVSAPPKEEGLVSETEPARKASARSNSSDIDQRDTLSDQILDLQDELADIQATFRICKHCAGHFIRDMDRRGPATEVPKKTSVQQDLEKLAYFAANEIQPAIREALNAAVISSYTSKEGDQNFVKDSVLEQLENTPSQFYSTKLRRLAELPSELEAEVTMKRSKARSELIVNLKTELIAYQKVAGTENPPDTRILEVKRTQMYEKVKDTKERCARMKQQLASTLKLQGLWRGVSCREAFRKKGIHISSPLEEHARKNLLPELKAVMNSDVAVRRELDPVTNKKRVFAGMVNAKGKAHGWGCIIYPKADVKHRTHYMGEFVDGLMHGMGVLSFEQGARYEGQFEDDLPHGYGIEYYASGAIYQGQFENDFRHGLGIYTFTSGLSYGGTWQKGVQHGESVETDIMLPSNPVRPRSGVLLSLNSMSTEQQVCMEAGAQAMVLAREMAAKGDERGSKEAVKKSIKLMDRAFKLTEKMRTLLENQDFTGRKLVNFVRGKKIIPYVPDPNALATDVLTGGWCELNIDSDNFPQTTLADSTAVIERNLLPAPTPAQEELEIQEQDLEIESCGQTDDSDDDCRVLIGDTLSPPKKGHHHPTVKKQHIPHHQHPDSHFQHDRDDRHYEQYVHGEIQSDNQSMDKSLMSAAEAFYERFPDAEHGPLIPGQPALVIAHHNDEQPWSLFQILILTEDDQEWWYEKETLRPGHPSLKERMRREQERYEVEMEQREFHECRMEEIMVLVSHALSCSVYYADWAKDGGAQTAAACSNLLKAMQRMPTLEAVDPKTQDGAEFIRALRKHREMQDLEEEEAARAAAGGEGEGEGVGRHGKREEEEEGEEREGEEGVGEGAGEGNTEEKVQDEGGKPSSRVSSKPAR